MDVLYTGCGDCSDSPKCGYIGKQSMSKNSYKMFSTWYFSPPPMDFTEPSFCSILDEYEKELAEEGKE